MSRKTKRIFSLLGGAFVFTALIHGLFAQSSPSAGAPLNHQELARFITLELTNGAFLFLVGFIGGLVSGFIGSGGAFVLTPAMMSLGVPATVAVASNMAHKFPKAMVGAYKRWKYGQVDIKLGLFMAVSAVLGVMIGIRIQQAVKNAWGEAGSNLYVSVSFVAVLLIVGLFVLRDALTSTEDGEKAPKLAAKLQAINLPPMIYFKTANIRISLWFTVPVGLATGVLAATIAVGGFVGVPGMMYVMGVSGLVASATELVVAFIMGMGGSIKWALTGAVDLRLTLLILGGSLFGVQLGAIGTTYVKEHVIKIVMASIMLIVALSRGVAIPIYLVQLNLLDWSQSTSDVLYAVSKISMGFALLFGAFIIVRAMWKGRAEAVPAPAVATSGEKILVPIDGSPSSMNALAHVLDTADTERFQITVISIMPPYEGYLDFSALGDLKADLAKPYRNLLVKAEEMAAERGVAIKKVFKEGEPSGTIAQFAEREKFDFIVMGRRGLDDLERMLMGSVTANVIGNSNENVLVLPRDAEVSWNNLLLVSDGTRPGELALDKVREMASLHKGRVTILSVLDVTEEALQEARGAVDLMTQKTRESLETTAKKLNEQGIQTDIEVKQGDPYRLITDFAREKNMDMIVMGVNRKKITRGIITCNVAEKIIGYAPCGVFVTRK